jgi:hypothetical protein
MNLNSNGIKSLSQIVVRYDQSYQWFRLNSIEASASPLSASEYSQLQTTDKLPARTV